MMLIGSGGDDGAQNRRESKGAVDEKTVRRLGLLKDYFVTRTDTFAFLASWNKPCRGRVSSRDDAEAVLLSHLLGTGAGWTARIQYERPDGTLGFDTEPRRVGAYALSPTSMCKWVCWDLDGGSGHASPLADPKAVAVALLAALSAAGIPAYLERSGGGHGYHVWVFFSEEVSGADARAFGLKCAPNDAGLLHGGVADPEQGRGVEVFPKTERLREGGFGSQVWLPWWAGAPDGANQFYAVMDGELVLADPDDFVTIPLLTVERVIGTPSGSGSGVRAADPGPPSEWIEWRRHALAKLDLGEIYGEWLTGKKQGKGWLQCRDPRSDTGDRTPSAGVADGTGDAERGAFHSFINDETISVFDFLVELGSAEDFRASQRLVAELSGVPRPTDDGGGFDVALEQFKMSLDREPTTAVERALAV